MGDLLPACKILIERPETGKKGIPNTAINQKMVKDRFHKQDLEKVCTVIKKTGTIFTFLEQLRKN